MAINPNTQYPGKIAAPSGNYPYGGAQNITVPGDGTGTPWEAALLNDIFGMQQSLLQSAGIVPSGSPETAAANGSQYAQAILEQISGRAINYTDTGAANDVQLDPKTNQYKPASYFIGLRVRWVATFTNTSNMRLRIGALGIPALLNSDGTALIANQHITGRTYEAVYDGVAYRMLNRLELITLDTPELLHHNVLAAVAWKTSNTFSAGSTTLVNANAERAIIKMTSQGSYVFTTLQLNGYLRKTGSGLAANIATEIVNHQYNLNTSALKFARSHGQSIVNLDTNSRFDAQFDESVVAASSELDIHLVGYYRQKLFY